MSSASASNQTEKAGLAAIAEKGHGKLMTVETAGEIYTQALKKVD